MIVKIESKEIFKMVYSHLKEGDALIIPTVRIIDCREEQALEKYMQMFDKGVMVYSIQEPYLQPLLSQIKRKISIDK